MPSLSWKLIVLKFDLNVFVTFAHSITEADSLFSFSKVKNMKFLNFFYFNFFSIFLTIDYTSIRVFRCWSHQCSAFPIHSTIKHKKKCYFIVIVVFVFSINELFPFRILAHSNLFTKTIVGEPPVGNRFVIALKLLTDKTDHTMPTAILTVARNSFLYQSLVETGCQFIDLLTEQRSSN